MSRPPELVARLEAGRRSILGAIGAPGDVALVTGAGNRGDELIVAGARALLAGLPLRELAAEEVAGSEGELALVIGSGAMSRAYNEWIPELLALAELRYERVIVLPSTADPAEDRVRDALARTRAIVFAREPRTLREIEGLCDARLAPDTAFYFDFSPFADSAGEGTLNAFRTDRERREGYDLPPGNDDISATADSLDEFLARIAAADLVRTDRAHVAIAAAMMGRRVEWRASSYFKVTEIVRWSLAGFDVAEIDPPHGAAPSRPATRPRSAPAAGTVAVIATRDRPEQCARATAAAIAAGAAEVVVVDRNSDPANRARLDAIAKERVRVIGGDRDAGRGGARARGVADAAGADSILLLDDDVAIEPSALAVLERALERDPGLAAAAAALLGPDGEIEQRGEWPSHSAILIRAPALARLPLDAAFGEFADQEWCLRAAAAGTHIATFPNATARRLSQRPGAHAYPFAESMRRLALCESLALIRARHGAVLAEVFDLLPELEGDPRRAALALDRLAATGRHRFAADWQAGLLAPLLGAQA